MSELCRSCKKGNSYIIKESYITLSQGETIIQLTEVECYHCNSCKTSYFLPEQSEKIEQIFEDLTKIREIK